MQRILEIIKESRVRYPDDTFFSNFEESIEGNIRKKARYSLYDRALKSLDDTSFQKLKDKALNHFLDHREGQKKQGFFHQLNEAFAFRYLNQKGFCNVKFVDETGTERRPDIEFYDGQTKRYCEVKSIGISENEIVLRSSGEVYSQNYENLDEGILNKIYEDVKKAREQIGSIEHGHLVYIIITFDDVSSDHLEEYKSQLISFCRSKDLKGIIFQFTYNEEILVEIS